MLTSALLFIVTCLIIPDPQAVCFYQPERENQQATARHSKETIITGIVVALGGRVVRDDGRCRQLIVVRTTGGGNGKLNNKYLLVPRNYNCEAGDFTNETFRNNRKWRFPLTRGVDCDHTFEEIKNIPLVSPGGGVGSVPWVKMVPGNDGEKMSATQKLLCYDLNGELKLIRPD